MTGRIKESAQFAKKDVHGHERKTKLRIKTKMKMTEERINVKWNRKKNDDLYVRIDEIGRVKWIWRQMKTMGNVRFAQMKTKTMTKSVYWTEKGEIMNIIVYQLIIEVAQVKSRAYFNRLILNLWNKIDIIDSSKSSPAVERSSISTISIRKATHASTVATATAREFCSDHLVWLILARRVQRRNAPTHIVILIFVLMKINEQFSYISNIINSNQTWQLNVNQTTLLVRTKKLTKIVVDDAVLF